MEPVEVLATALETPYGTAVLSAAMIEPIRLPGDVREPIVVAELCEWPQGLPPLVGETWEEYRIRIDRPNFHIQDINDLVYGRALCESPKDGPLSLVKKLKSFLTTLWAKLMKIGSRPLGMN